MSYLRIGAWCFGAGLLAGAAVADDDATKPENVMTEESAASPEAEFSSPLNLGYADFVPQSAGSDDCHYDTPSEGNAGFVAADGFPATCCLAAGVQLPDGATVTAIVFYLLDVGTHDVTISLRRKWIHDETSSVVMGTVTTSASQEGVRLFSDLSITSGVVDNRNYTYFVSTDTCLDQELDLRLVSGLIFFSEGP